MKSMTFTKRIVISILSVFVVLCMTFGFVRVFASDTDTWTGDWTYSSEAGGYSPNSENAVMQYGTKLTGDFKVNLDVTLSSAGAVTTDFQVAVFAEEGNSDMAQGYTVAINTVNNYVSVVNNTANSGAVINLLEVSTLRDDTAKTLSVISNSGKLYVLFEGETVVAGRNLAVTEGYLNVSSPSIYDVVSNFNYQTNYVPTEDELKGEDFVGINLDFEESADFVDFKGVYLGWTNVNGIIRPAGPWGSTYLNIPLVLNKEGVKTVITVDFCTEERLNFGFSQPDGTEGIFTKITSAGVLFNSFIGNNTTGWIADVTGVNFADGQKHQMKVIFKNGTANFYIDEALIHGGIAVNNAPLYLFMQGGQTVSTMFIDNFVVTETPFVFDADFSMSTDSTSFASKYNTWVVDNGRFRPNVNWANTYYKNPLDLTENHVIDFDFCLEEAKDSLLTSTNQIQFGFVHLEDGVNTLGKGLAVSIHTNANYQRYMACIGNDIGNRSLDWIEDSYRNFFDGKEHHITIKVANSRVEIYADGTPLFNSIAVTETPAYLLFCATSTAYYIDNFMISAGEALSYDVENNFEEATDIDDFKDCYENWCISTPASSNVKIIKPILPWTSTYKQDGVKLDGENYVSFYFNVATTFKFGLVEYVVDYNDIGKGLVMDLTGATATLRRGVHGTDEQVAQTENIYYDGFIHKAEIFIDDGVVTFCIDGVVIGSATDIKVDFAHLYLQLEGCNSNEYVSNLKIAKVVDVEDTILENTTVGENEVLLGYKVTGGKYDGLYKVGSTVELRDGISVVPVRANFYMLKGASVRISEIGGLRWRTYLANADYEKILSLDANATFGTLITSAGSTSSVDIPVVNGSYIEGDNFAWNGSLINILEKNYNRVLRGTGYVKLTYADGSTETIFAVNNDNDRSYFGVMTSAYNDVKTSSDGNEYVTAVTNLDGETVYTCYSESQYGYIKNAYNTIKTYLGV